jgi:hypothetical protein
MTAAIFGSLILSHLHKRDGNKVLSWAYVIIAGVACAAMAVMEAL